MFVDPMAWTLRWEPSGDAVWVSPLGDGAGSDFQPVDVSTGESRTLTNSFDLGVDHLSPVEGDLVQISDDGRIGLVLFQDLRGSRAQDPLSFGGIIDLQTGATGPVLRSWNGDGRAVDHHYYQAHAYRLNADGRSVLVSYCDERPTYSDDAVEQPLRLVRVSTSAILAGAPEPELLVEDLSVLTDVPVPQVMTTTLGLWLSVVPLPGDDQRIPLPMDRRSFDGPRAQRVEAILKLTLDRPF